MIFSFIQISFFDDDGVMLWSPEKKYYYYHQTIPLKEIVWIDMDTMAIIIRREREKNVCVCKSFIYEHNTHRNEKQKLWWHWFDQQNVIVIDNNEKKI